MNLNRLTLSLCLLLIPFTAHSQQAAIQNPQAVVLATQALTALTGPTQVSDITLTGTATHTAGSDVQTGNITLKALGNQASRFDLVLTPGTCSEIRNASGGTPQGSWIAPNGVSHAMAYHNTLTDAAWFAPQLTVLSQISNPNLIVSYIGPETRVGAAVQHLHFAFQSASADPTGFFFQGLTAEEVYLDASTFLPAAITFSAHPDNDANTNIPVEIHFSNYQLVQGAQVPFRIQKFMNGTLFLDLTIQTAVLNSGLTNSAFLPN
jgi:hypothetical protein